MLCPNGSGFPAFVVDYLTLSNNPVCFCMMYSIIQPLKRNPCPSSAYLEVIIKSKKSVTQEMLQSLVDKFSGKNAFLADLHGLAICILGCAGFLRHDEIAGLRFCDVKIVEDHLDLFIHPTRETN